MVQRVFSLCSSSAILPKSFWFFGFGFLALGSVALVGLSAGCADPLNPCITLAERICRCEASISARESCRQVRVEALRNKIEVTDEEKDVCWEKLSTCECSDIDENRVEECGFIRE